MECFRDKCMLTYHIESACINVSANYFFNNSKGDEFSNLNYSEFEWKINLFL